MKCAVIVLASLSWSALTAASLAAEATPQHSSREQTIWATWITRDVQIDLKGLPRSYTCDELFYKLRGVLFAIGARSYMAITPYHCGVKAADGGHSPTLDLKFQTLRVLSDADKVWAQTRAIHTIVRIAPGDPKMIDANDCALLAQLNETLFAYLDLNVQSADLQCSKPQSAQKFSVSIDALLAQPSDRPPA